MPIRDWAAIRKSLIATYNPTVAAKFTTPVSSTDQQTINLMQVQSNDSSLIAQSRITLYNQQFPNQAIAAIPDWWAVRVGAGRPQMIFRFAVKLAQNSGYDSAKYVISVPHPVVKHYTTSPIPSYQKGQIEGIITLSDNSKVVINAISAEEVQRVLDAIKLIIIPSFLEGQSTKIGPRSGYTLITDTVYARTASYFSSGFKNMKPDWIDLFQ
jgi:hypothetical protein